MNPLLIIEDDPGISELLRINLEYAGFKVHLSQNIAQARQILLKNKFDMVLLDLMLPDGDGFNFIGYITERQIPLIIISAKDRIQDKIKGLDLGADDYLCKPFDHIELLARVKALLRRTHKKENILIIEDIHIDLNKERACCRGKEIELTLKEYQLLECLAENRGMIFSRRRLLEQIWGYEAECDTRTVDIHIMRLRHKLVTPIIQTVYKRGYKIPE